MKIGVGESVWVWEREGENTGVTRVYPSRIKKKKSLLSYFFPSRSPVPTSACLLPPTPRLSSRIIMLDLAGTSQTGP